MNYYDVRLSGKEGDKIEERSIPVMAENETEAIKSLAVEFAKIVVFDGASKVEIAFDGKDTFKATNDNETVEMKLVSITPLFTEMENGGFSLSLEAKEE